MTANTAYADDTEDLEISLDEQVADDDGKQQKKKSDEELADLRKQVEASNKRATDESARAEAAQKERDEARQRVSQAVNESVASTEVAIENAIAAYTRDGLALNEAYVAALKANDHAKAAELNDKLLDAKVNLTQAKAQKAQLEAWKKDQTEKLEAAAKVQQQDPLAAFTELTRRWMKDHPDATPGGKDWNKAMAAHNLAVDQGIKTDTPEYFSFIDDFLETSTVPAARQNGNGDVRRSTATPAAPPSRGNGAGGSRAPDKIKLTARERDLAINMTSLGNTEDERIKNYAKNKATAIKNGEIPENAA